MSQLADDFWHFLVNKHKKTGQNSFYSQEYEEFEGYKDAITELCNRGLLYAYNDVIGTIEVRIPSSQK